MIHGLIKWTGRHHGSHVHGRRGPPVGKILIEIGKAEHATKTGHFIHHKIANRSIERCVVKHKCHGLRGRRVPGSKRLVKGEATIEHVIKGGDAIDHEVIDRLVKRKGIGEHGIHFGGIGGVPKAERLVELTQLVK